MYFALLVIQGGPWQ